MVKIEFSQCDNPNGQQFCRRDKDYFEKTGCGCRTHTIKGGTGYGIYDALPDEVDDMFPDYSIYPESDYAIGFLTRGCIRNCDWCVVPKKEGKTRPVPSSFSMMPTIMERLNHDMFFREILFEDILFGTVQSLDDINYNHYLDLIKIEYVSKIHNPDRLVIDMREKLEEYKKTHPSIDAKLCL